jgi:hypothetical protein
MLLAAPSALRAAPDPCQLLTAAEITTALGRAPARGKLSKADRVDETKSVTTTCSMEVGDELLIISMIEFDDVAAAQRWFPAYLKLSEEDLGVKMTPQSDLGERAAWGSWPTPTWLVLKGKYALNVMFDITAVDGTKLREPLRRLAASALSRL